MRKSENNHSSKWNIWRSVLDSEIKRSPKTTDVEIEILGKLYDAYLSSVLYESDKDTMRHQIRILIWDSILNRGASYEQMCQLMQVVPPHNNTIWKEMFYGLENIESDVRSGKDLIRAAASVLSIDNFSVNFDLIKFYKDLMDSSKDDYYPKLLVGNAEMVTTMLQELNSKLISMNKNDEIYGDKTTRYVMSFLLDILRGQYHSIEKSAQLKNAFRQLIDTIQNIEKELLQQTHQEDRQYFDVVYAPTVPVNSSSMDHPR